MAALTAGVMHSPMQDMAIVPMQPILRMQGMPLAPLDSAEGSDSAEAWASVGAWASVEALAEEDGGKLNN